jgi:hypothetical protein
MLWEFYDLLGVVGVNRLADVTPGQCGAYLYRVTARGAPPAENTVVNRRVTLRGLFKPMRDISGTDPSTRVDPVPSRPTPSIRALTDQEMAVAQQVAAPGVSESRVALAQACISSGEVCDVQVRALDDLNEPTLVRRPGRQGGPEREHLLTDWGRVVLGQRVRDLDGSPDALLAYMGRGGPGSSARRSSASKDLAKVLGLAGLRSDESVMPKSITYWGAVRCLGLGATIGEVAYLLGVKEDNLPRILR